MSGLEVILKAIRVAVDAHKSAVRKFGDGLYIVHPARVAARVSQILFRGSEFRSHAIATAWLHDVVEDTEYTLEDLRAFGFPEEVVDAVDAVSRREGEKYFDFIDRADGNPIGKVVKIEDIRDNMATLPESEKSMQDRYKKSLYRLGVVDAG